MNQVFLKKIIFPLLRPILRKNLFGFSKNLLGFFFVLLGMPTFLQAYIPGESFVSLTDDQGLFSNPAGLSAFDSKGGLLSYEYSEEKVHQLQLGFNLGALGFSFDYQTDQKGFNESRWNLTHSFPLFHRSLFFGHRLTAFRSADFNGTAMTYSPGLLWRPVSFLSLGFASYDLLNMSSQEIDRVQEIGAAFRVGRKLTLGYESQNLKDHQVFLQTTISGLELGFQIPVYGENSRYKLSLSYPLDAYINTAVTVFDDFIPRRLALSYHHSRNPNAYSRANIIRVPLSLPVKEVQDRFSFFKDPSMSVWAIRNHFEQILHDPSTGIIIFDFSGYTGGAAISKEIQRGISTLRESGRKVVAYLDDVRPTVLLASATADRIVVEPSARVNLRGLAGTSLYYKGFLDWIGVDVQFLRHGDYKSAVEPYTMDSMSVEARSDRESLYNEWWNVLIEDFQKRLPAGVRVDDFVKNPLLTASSAKSRQWVDTILYVDQLPAYALKEFFGFDVPQAKAITWAPTNRNILANDWAPRSKVAVLNIEGTIDKNTEVESIALIDEVMQEGKYEALIVRINSPGGDAQASEKIWRALRVLSKSGTPVIASVGDMAASGGYYIACGADLIIAEKTSIVGSIGIFGGKVNASALLEKLKIRPETVKTHEHADAESFSRSFSEVEKKALQEYMDDFYARFTKVVSDATKIPQEKVDQELGGGRVFIGKTALSNGLVHSLGGFDEAIAAVKRLASIRESKQIELVPLISKNSYINRITFKSLAEFVSSFDGDFIWALESDLWPLLQ
jgi:protease-4